MTWLLGMRYEDTQAEGRCPLPHASAIRRFHSSEAEHAEACGNGQRPPPGCPRTSSRAMSCAAHTGLIFTMGTDHGTQPPDPPPPHHKPIQQSIRRISNFSSSKVVNA
eukprot:463073-Prorocentrum_minimum.AAC.1